MLSEFVDVGCGRRTAVASAWLVVVLCYCCVHCPIPIGSRCPGAGGLQLRCTSPPIFDLVLLPSQLIFILLFNSFQFVWYDSLHAPHIIAVVPNLFFLLYFRLMLPPLLGGRRGSLGLNEPPQDAHLPFDSLVCPAKMPSLGREL